MRVPGPRLQPPNLRPIHCWKLLCIFACYYLLTLIGRCAEAPGPLPVGTTKSALPSLEEVMASSTDVWGEAAMKQHNGASYEFFEPLLPPLRYVNADFTYYPIVLSAPNAKVKARLISNGSGVNLRGGSRSWNDIGTAVKFRV